MKKKKVKQKQKFSKKLIVLVTLSVLLVVSILVVGLLKQQQELRSRAAGSNITFVSSSPADTGTTANATQLTIPAPKGIQAGDVMVALLQADYGHLGATLPDGWVLVMEHNENDDLAAHTYYKIATGTEPANYTWTIINTDDTKKAKKQEALGGGTIMAFRGVDKQNPIFAKALNPETTDPTKADCPSVDAPAGGMLVCLFVDDDPAPDMKVPASMTRVSNFIIRNNDAHAAAYEKIPNAGQTGTRVASFTVPASEAGDGNNDIGIGIVLQPGTASQPTPTQPQPTGVTVVPSTYCLGCVPSAAPSATPAAIPSPEPQPSPTTAPSGTGKGFLVEFLTLLLLLLRAILNIL